ncbi:MAG: beta-lactamase family protein [Gammaproteobacteria bacterium]|nr:beta-lactamase family protein [Gammaproteobacteria bacterium]MBU2056272.1 beta-lactamase family protein [Gammaproteobacteria bacterium]MBU2174687.1 beta-lactamase family protein [Gammaproteobacteria bacterium]MBU2248848.1 beta-lactamase family protein [Gammaproteobacteria bacterium]MBU2344555.1 beta-lactamase family protein [Gammaproteobacteria bacterium]
MKKRGITAAVVLLAGAVVAWDQLSGWTALSAKQSAGVLVQTKVYQSEFQATAEQAMTALKQSQRQGQFPALTAAVAWRGQLLWAGAAGYADLESQKPASIESQFRIGSTSKAVTATALARAVAAGAIDLDAPISRYKTDLPNPLWQDLTLRQLMSHTAGLPGYKENTDWIGAVQTLLKQAEFHDVHDALSLFDESKLLFPAGTAFHYSSFDVNLASAVLQSAVQTPFLQYLNAQVSLPLGLSSLAASELPSAHQASFYRTHDGYAKKHREVNLSQRWAGGGLAASSVDLAVLGSAWFNPDFIPAAVQQQFWTPQKLRNGEVNEQSYALGWRNFSQKHLFCDKDNPLSRTVSFVHHGGVSSGAQSWLVIYPELQLVVAMNTNTVKENYCDFAKQAALITRPFLQQIAPDWVNETSAL